MPIWIKTIHIHKSESVRTKQWMKMKIQSIAKIWHEYIRQKQQIFLFETSCKVYIYSGKTKKYNYWILNKKINKGFPLIVNGRWDQITLFVYSSPISSFTRWDKTTRNSKQIIWMHKNLDLLFAWNLFNSLVQNFSNQMNTFIFSSMENFQLITYEYTKA